MMRQNAGGDLFVLVADEDMKRTMDALLVRSKPLGVGRFVFDIERHARKDPGCRSDAADYLRPRLNEFRYCLVMFDHHGCGSTKSRTEIQASVEDDLERNGWKDRAKVIVIEPELEAWVWGDLSAVCGHLGWEAAGRLRKWLSGQGLWPHGQDKPDDPKGAMTQAMKQAPRRGHGRRTARTFAQIAESAKLDDCRDPAFRELMATLQRWFPADEPEDSPSPAPPEPDNRSPMK